MSFIDKSAEVNLDTQVSPGAELEEQLRQANKEIDALKAENERLQDISEEDAIAEGCNQNHNGYFWAGPHHEGGRKQLTTARAAYRDVWESINGADSWDANPWVWVIEFKRIEQ